MPITITPFFNDLPHALPNLDGLDELSFIKVLSENTLDLTKKWATHFKTFQDVIVIGTGGSSLGGQTLKAFAKNHSPRVHFFDNVDAFTYLNLTETLDPHNTGLITISKSGETLETIASAILFMGFLKGHLKDKIVCITDPKESTLRTLAKDHHFSLLDHPPYVGGRFSVLSIVGLLPAAIMGLDIQSLLNGAKHLLERFKLSPLSHMSPYVAAHNHIKAFEQGKSLSVMMPYSDTLKTFALWHAQLWGESLGKNGFGLTPLPALGAVDQHSQLQLYLDGPQDKTFTFFHIANAPSFGFHKDKIPQSFHYLQGKTLHHVMEAEFIATKSVLDHKGFITRTFTLQNLDMESLGALFMHFMLETHFTAELKGLNAYDQPAVEEGKIRARNLLESRHL